MRKFVFLFIILITIPNINAQVNPKGVNTDFKLWLYETIPTGEESARAIFHQIVSAELSVPKKLNGVNEFTGVRRSFTFDQVAKRLGLKKKGVLTISSKNITYNEIDSLVFATSGVDEDLDVSYILKKPNLIQKAQYEIPSIVYDIDASFLKQHTVAKNKITPIEDEKLKKIVLDEVGKYVADSVDDNPSFYLLKKEKFINYTDKNFFDFFYLEITTIENVPADEFCIATFYNKGDQDKRCRTTFFLAKNKIAFAGHFINLLSFKIDKKWYLACNEYGSWGSGGWGRQMYIYENGEFKMLVEDYSYSD